MTEQELWIVPDQAEGRSDHSAREWEQAEEVVDRFIDLAACFDNDALTLCLFDAWSRARVAKERAREQAGE